MHKYRPTFSTLSFCFVLADMYDEKRPMPVYLKDRTYIENGNFTDQKSQQYSTKDSTGCSKSDVFHSKGKNSDGI